VDGLNIHAWKSAEKEGAATSPVVLVHGLGMSSRYMLPLAQHLSSEALVYAIDLPGAGHSDRPPNPLSVRETADLLAAWTGASGLGRACFVGNSLGCEILVELAMNHPERVISMILQGPTADPKYLSPFQHIGRFMLTGLFERWSLGWIAISDYLNFGVARFRWTFRDMIANRIEHKLPKVSAPTLVVWGTRDYIVPRRSVQRVAELLPNGQMIIVPGAAHGMNYSSPELLAEAIARFRRLQSAGDKSAMPRSNSL
jgi:pimeloyl-ACP methyl ester carboxylesterase